MRTVTAGSTVLPELPDRFDATDDALVVRALGGESEALERLVEKYRPRIYTFALGILLRPDDAEDVTQETFLRAVTTLPGYQRRGQFRAWLYRIATNLCHDVRRRSGRIPHPFSEEELRTLAVPGDASDRVIAEAAMLAALARLPEKYRDVMVLRCLEELSAAEIAIVLNRPVNLVRVQLWRARGVLVRELGDWLE